MEAATPEKKIAVGDLWRHHKTGLTFLVMAVVEDRRSDAWLVKCFWLHDYATTMRRLNTVLYPAFGFARISKV